jgi:O-antigen ligase
MPVLFAALTCFAAVWGVIALARGSTFLSAAIYLVLTVCCPAEFFSADIGGLTWTLGRAWFVVMMIQAGFCWWFGNLKFRGWGQLDLAIGMFLVWLFIRTITQPLGTQLPGQPPTLMHFVDGYAVPFCIYLILRGSRLRVEQLPPTFVVIVALGFYLDFTAFMEIAKQWTLVFPRFIADPELGIHFGRARGPLLQSVRMGICLIACWIPLAIFGVWCQPRSRLAWAMFAASIPLAWGAVLLTYTRSVWMGLIAVIGLLSITLLQGLPRRALLFGMLSACLLVGVVKGPELVAFKREFSAAETRESTYMRAAFAYVSLEMFKDRPIGGFGFNQFQVHNRPYLSDRTTDIRLESIRGYVHHNSYLSLLVDLGIVGFILYMLVLAVGIREAWSLWRQVSWPRWARGIGLAAIAVTGVHLLQMLFHEVSFSAVENGFLYAAFGVMMAAKRKMSDSDGTGTCDLEHSDRWR